MTRVAFTIPIPIMDLNGAGFLRLLDLCNRYPAFRLETLCLIAGNCLNAHDSLDEFLDSPIDYFKGGGPVATWREVLEKWDFYEAADAVNRCLRTRDD